MLNVLLISKDTEDLHHLQVDLTGGEDADLTIQWLDDLASVDQTLSNGEVSAILVKPGDDDFVSLDTLREWSQRAPTICLCDSMDPSALQPILSAGVHDVWIRNNGQYPMARQRLRNATHLHRQQTELRSSNFLLKMIGDHLHDIVWLFDLSTMTVSSVSGSVERILGYTSEEASHLRLDELFTPASFQYAIEMLAIDQAALRSGEMIKSGIDDMDVVAKDGRIVSMEFSTNYFMDATGNIKLVGVARSLAERRRFQLQMQQQEKNYRFLYETITQGVIYQDATGWVVDANPAASRILRTNRQKLVTEKTEFMRWKIVREDGTPVKEADHPFTVAKKTRRPVENEILGLTHPRYPETIWLRLHVVPILEPETGTVQMVYTLFEDISSLLQTQHELRDSEERFRQMVETIEEVFWIYDNVEQKTAYLSPASERKWGVVPGHFLESDEFQLVHPEDKKVWDENIAKQRAGLETSFQYRIIQPNGITRWVQDRSYPVFDQDGILLRTIGVAQDMTEVHQAQENMRDSEERLRQVVETIDEVFWIYNNNTEALEYLSPSFEHIWGLVRQEYLASDPLQLVHPDDQDHWNEIVRQQREGQETSFDYRIIRPEGAVRWVHSDSYPVFDENQRLIRTVGVVKDITEQHRMIDALRDSEELFREMFYQHPAVKLLIDPDDGRIVEANQAAVEYYGWTQEVLQQMTIHDINILSREEVQAEMQLARKRQRIYFEFRHRRADGSVRDVAVFSGSVNYHGRPILHSIVHDITNQKQAEEELLSSLQRFRVLAEVSLVGVWTTDPQGKNTYVSPRWTEIAGRSAQEALGTGWSLGLHPDDREAVFTGWEAAALEGEPYVSEFRFVHADGRIVWVLCQALPVRGADDEIVSWVGSIVDITDQKSRQNQLENRIEDMQLINRVHESIWQGNDLKTTVAVMTRGLEEAFHSEGGLTLFRQPDTEYLYVQEMDFVSQVASRLEKIIGKKAADLPLRIPTTGNGYFAQVMQTGESVRLTTPGEVSAVMAEFTDSKLLQHLIPPVMKALQLQSVLLLPLEIDGERFGVASLNRTYLFTEEEQRRAEVILNQMVTAVSRQRLAGELAVSEERYRGLVEALDSVLVIVNQDGNLLYANDNFEKFFHIKREVLMGKHVSFVFPPEFVEEIRQSTAVVLSDQLPVTLEAPVPIPDGDHWFRITMQPLKVVNGEGFHVLIHASDIHDLKTTQAKLETLNTTLEERVEERTNELQDLYDNAPNGYHSLDADGVIVLMNKTHADWLGYTVDELLGRSIESIMTPESIAGYHQSYPIFVATGEPVRDLAFDFIRKDGSIMPVLLSSKALYDSDGNYLFSRTTIFDNSERQKAEEALRESEKTYRALFEATNDAVFLLSLQGEYLTVNQRAAEMLGFDSPEQLSGVDSKDYLAPAEHAQADNVLVRLLNDERIFPYERTMVKKDGTRIIAEITPSLVRDETGEPKMIQSVVRDVTRRREEMQAVQESEERLRRANLTLEKAAQLKDEFLASMSHELRTPLTSILALSEAMQYETFGDVNEKQKKALANIEESGRHLLDLINDILDLSKLDAGKLDVSFEWYPLHEICQASLILVKGMANKKRQVVKFSTNVPTAMVYADPRRLKQVIVNLLSNAVKFTEEGKTIGLEVQALEEQRRIEIIVWDTGMGMAAEDLPRLFQPFVQLDSSLARKHSGTGLGLSLVKRMIELHGGSVHVESTLGEGSRFTVVLPWNPAGEEQTQASSDQQHPDSSLVVEDDPLDAQRLRNYLKALGIDVTVVDTGAEVLTTAIDQQPGLVLLDLNLPDMHGFSVLQALKEEKRTTQIPVVIASIDDERARARELGASGYLVKPFSMVELQQEITGLFPLGESRSQAMLVEKMNMKPMVLLAEDTEVTLDTVSYFLNSKNFHVLEAHDGFEVLELLEQHVPDVILMDIQMPGMDGLETIQHIRQNPDPRVANMPIIALTALAMDGDRDRCLSAGADDYLSKPVRLDTLTEKLFYYLQKRSQGTTTKPERGE